jgi:hypothetical protein
MIEENKTKSAKNDTLLTFSFIGLLVVPLIGMLGQPAYDASLEVTSKRYSAGYVPVVGSYVEYEVRLTNEGTHSIENQFLRVSLVAENGGTNSGAEYSLLSIAPGESLILHLGPFKIEGEGEHRLHAEIDSVIIDYRPDSFSVYRQETLQTVYVAIPLVVAGSGLIGFSVYRKRRAV